MSNCLFPGSSAVERLAVNEKVPGSIPGRGAKDWIEVRFSTEGGQAVPEAGKLAPEHLEKFNANQNFRALSDVDKVFWGLAVQWR